MKNQIVNKTAGSFSAEQLFSEKERLALESRYEDIIEETTLFSRKTVSFQANKVEALHGWMKYREGYAADLVKTLFELYDIKAGAEVLDPFAGSATTLLQAMTDGINATGFEILPNCILAWKAKSNVYKYSLAEIDNLISEIKINSAPISLSKFKHLSITDSAFTESTEQEILGFKEWITNSNYSLVAKDLFLLLLMDCLEDVSYTKKDGQYLRWDARAEKIKRRNDDRMNKGKKPIKGVNKGEIPPVREVLLNKLYKVRKDIELIQNQGEPIKTRQQLIQGNVLLEIKNQPTNKYDAVITSPPYVNRYDYTRTYALELAYLDIGENIFELRQTLLSSNVESRSKMNFLKQQYKGKNTLHKWEQVLRNAKVLSEIENALTGRQTIGDVNNKGIINMVTQYFQELSLLFIELYRVTKPGGLVCFVNDNVRYAGEVIPVDTISTFLAELAGFIPKKIYVIPQRKGNSSQQMKKFGVRTLRKSITIWRK